MDEKIRLHRVYRTRNNCPAFIVDIDAEGMRPVIARVVEPDGFARTNTYTARGFAISVAPQAAQPEHDLDLVADISRW